MLFYINKSYDAAIRYFILIEKLISKSLIDITEDIKNTLTYKEIILKRIHDQHSSYDKIKRACDVIRLKYEYDKGENIFDINVLKHFGIYTNHPWTLLYESKELQPPRTSAIIEYRDYSPCYSAFKDGRKVSEEFFGSGFSNTLEEFENEWRKLHVGRCFNNIEGLHAYGLSHYPGYYLVYYFHGIIRVPINLIDKP